MTVFHAVTCDMSNAYVDPSVVTTFVVMSMLKSHCLEVNMSMLFFLGHQHQCGSSLACEWKVSRSGFQSNQLKMSESQTSAGNP